MVLGERGMLVLPFLESASPQLLGSRLFLPNVWDLGLPG